MQVTKANLRLALKTILFTTDFTPASDAALPYVSALARWYGSKIVVVHCVEPEPILNMPMEPMPQDMDFNWRTAQGKMDNFLHSHPLEGTAHETLLLQGDLWDVIADVIRRHEIDLVVLGTHGREGIKKLVMGSSAEQIFRRATCPVLTVGPRVARESVQFENWKRILFATDFSSGSLGALPYALSLAEENQAGLSLLHMIALVPMQREEFVIEAARKRLEVLVPREAAAWCNPEFVVQVGFPADGILRVAEERGADLIVMGVHTPRSARASTHLPWAIAHEVVSHAHCPVLTVRG
jgi:nucleotide-binding universal stress UspA family protein